MAGTSIASAQSQSRRPSFVGSLTTMNSIPIDSFQAYLLLLGLIEIVLMEDERVGKDVAEQPSKRCFAARGTA